MDDLIRSTLMAVGTFEARGKRPSKRKAASDRRDSKCVPYARPRKGMQQDSPHHKLFIGLLYAWPKYRVQDMARKGDLTCVVVEYGNFLLLVIPRRRRDQRTHLHGP
jgi:hypothetical protein